MTISNYNNGIQILLSPNQRFLMFAQNKSKGDAQTKIIAVDLSHYSYANWRKGLSQLKDQVTPSFNILKIQELLSALTFSSPRMISEPAQTQNAIERMAENPIMNPDVWALIGQMEPMGSLALLTMFERSLPSGNLRSLANASKRLSLKDLSLNDLGKLLENATRDGSEELALELIESNRFKEMRLEDLEKTLETAAGKGRENVVKALIQSNRFKEISPVTLGWGLVFAAKNGHTTIVEALIESNQIGIIPRANLGETLRAAAKRGDGKIFKMLTSLPRFKEINRIILEQVFKEAAQNGKAEIVELLVQSSRFSEIRPNNLNSAFVSAAEKGHSETLRKLIQSSRFSEISKDSLELAFRLAVEEGHVDATRTLLADPRIDPSAIFSDGKTAPDFTKNQEIKTLLDQAIEERKKLL